MSILFQWFINQGSHHVLERPWGHHLEDAFGKPISGKSLKNLTGVRDFFWPKLGKIDGHPSMICF